MAQLRDAKTSEIVHEGTPLECVLMAEQIGKAVVVEQRDAGDEKPIRNAELIYDDVGLNFDPDAVLSAHRENVAGLEGAANDAKTASDRKAVTRHLDQAKADAKVDRKHVDRAKRALEAARKAQEEAAAAGR